VKHWSYSCLFILLALSVRSVAQETPWWELYGGFQFTGYQTVQMQKLVNSRATSSGLLTSAIGNRANLIGWNFSTQENANSWFGGVVDFSGGYGSKRVTLSTPGKLSTVSSFKPALFTMGGGPQFSYRRNDRIQPFFRMIIAAAYVNLNPDANTTSIVVGTHPAPSMNDTNLALMFGGGVDYLVKKYACFRISGDYIHSFVFNESENSYRVSAGVSFRIGNR